jgi:hypothetical protein
VPAVAEKRVNPNTGVVEENQGLIFDNWQPSKNSAGHQERVNPTTGLSEENRGLVFDDWQPSKNSDGNQQRTNTTSGVYEENRGIIFDNWQASKNSSGNQQRTNPNNGVSEVNHGIIFDNWRPSINQEGNQERLNPKTGTVEENIGIIFDNWRPSSKTKRQGNVKSSNDHRSNKNNQKYENRQNRKSNFVSGGGRISSDFSLIKSVLTLGFIFGILAFINRPENTDLNEDNETSRNFLSRALIAEKRGNFFEAEQLFVKAYYSSSYKELVRKKMIASLDIVEIPAGRVNIYTTRSDQTVIFGDPIRCSRNRTLDCGYFTSSDNRIMFPDKVSVLFNTGVNEKIRLDRGTPISSLYKVAEKYVEKPTIEFSTANGEAARVYIVAEELAPFVVGQVEQRSEQLQPGGLSYEKAHANDPINPESIAPPNDVPTLPGDPNFAQSPEQLMDDLSAEPAGEQLKQDPTKVSPRAAEAIKNGADGLF